MVAAEATGQSPNNLSGPWHTLLEPVGFTDAVMRETQSRMEGFIAGVRGYQAHPFRRTLSPAPEVWRHGAASLRAYGGDGPPVVYVPSLINRAYILDLNTERSLLRASAQAGLQSFLLDWGEPGETERAFGSQDYVLRVLIPALEDVKARTGQAPRLVGYCMGGTMTVAPAVLRPDLLSALVLLAAPWDFHADSEATRALMNVSRPTLEAMLAAEGVASVDLLQALFASLDPTLAGRKFRDFAALDAASDKARRFVELEDWVNDGVPLVGPLARECLFGWYGANDPAHGRWRVGGTVIDPRHISHATLAVIPSQDRIVPPKSAHALAAAIPGAEIREVPFGHVGMMAGGGAAKRVHAPLLAWLRDPPTR